MADPTTNVWISAAAQFRGWLREQGKSPFTMKNYLHDLRMFGRWHRKLYGYAPDPSGLQPLDFLAYRNYLQTERRQSISTVNRRVAALKSLADFLHARQFTSQNIGESVAYIASPPQVAPDVLTHAQVLQLFKCIDRTRRLGKRDYAIIQLFVQCGLRLKELADIRLPDVIIKQRAGMLRIASGKGNRPREIPLNKTAREAIEEYLHVRPRLNGVDHLFFSQKKRPLAPRSIQDVVKKYLKKAGVGNFSCHSLRHLFATNLYNEHKDIVLVKEALGHKRLGTTLRYSHKTQKEIQDALENTPLNVMR
jgi:integrase/recombinase XerD